MIDKSFLIQFTRTGIECGIFEIRYYAVCYVLAFVAVKTLVERKTKINHNLMVDTFIYGVIGGRLGYILLDWPEDVSILTRLKDGIFSRWYGMDFKSGLLVAIVAYFILTRQRKIENALVIFQETMTSMPIGIGIGRFGNFLNNEFMDPVQIFNIQMPVCIFAMLTEGLISFAIMQIVDMLKLRYKGLYFFMSYSAMRFINDIYRTEPNVWHDLSRSQLICIVIFGASLSLLCYKLFHHRFTNSTKL